VTTWHRSFVLAVACVVVSAAVYIPEAHAQAGDTASALTLFEEGKRLAAEGRHAEACPKLQASYNLVQKLGTLLNLADCFERTGRTASAWARFTEAQTMAERTGQEERAEFARSHAAALAPKLSRLVITVASPAPPGLEVRRDGAVVDPAAFGSAVPLDPGTHTIEARAPQARTWTRTIDVAPETALESAVVVPALEPLTEASPPAASPPIVAPPPVLAAPPAEAPSGRTQRTWGLVLGGVGVAGLTASLISGAVASSEYQSSNQDGHCTNDVCTSRGLEQRDTAKTVAGLATGLFIGGAALVGAGIVLYLTAPSEQAAARTSLSVGPGSLVLGRSW
jgi:hypothetical protein